MKTRMLIIVVLFCLGKINAQYTVLFNMDSLHGDWPDNPLTISGKTLFGATGEGGAKGYGCIFSIDTNGNSYKDLYDFNGTSGEGPFSTLVLSGKVLYGVTAQGGANNIGCIFSLDTNGLGYRDLLDFSLTNGQGDEHTLTLCGKNLYGTTYIGGVGGHGRMFSIDTAGGGYRDLLDTNIDGSSLVLSGHLFYGVSSEGVNGFGSIFSVDTNGKGYKTLFNFVDTNAGPFLSLTLKGGLLYGVGSWEDTLYNEYIFSIDTDGSGFKERYVFPYFYPVAENPNVPLIVSGNKIYVITSYWGADLQGNVFSVDTNGKSYTDMVDFDGTNGGEPFATMILSGGILYGTTSQGGSGNYGVVFKIDTNAVASVSEVSSAKRAINIFPNPNNGIFTIALSHPADIAGSQTIEVYNVLGERIFETLKPMKQVQGGQVQGDYEINMSNQPNGVYFYRVLSEDGSELGSGKVIIQK